VLSELDKILYGMRVDGPVDLPPMELSLDLVGVAEAAELLGIGKAAFSERRRHKGFPKPAADLRCGLVWLRAQIEHYELIEAILGPRGWHGRRRPTKLQQLESPI
jgi:hypothetical protein